MLRVAARQWFFRRCSLACSGRASARVYARLGGCCGQLAHTARSAARCIYLRGSQSARKQKQQRRFRAVKRAIAERTTPAFYAKRLTASARPLDTFAANASGLEVGFVLRARAPARRRRCRSSERASAAHLRPLFARSMSSALARCRQGGVNSRSTETAAAPRTWRVSIFTQRPKNKGARGH